MIMPSRERFYDLDQRFKIPLRNDPVLDNQLVHPHVEHRGNLGRKQMDGSATLRRQEYER